jgi:tetratricopeptide (TPR) repeat protein
MSNILSFLSGQVPGGLLLLFFILVAINLALYFFYKSSKLFSKDVYKNKAWKYNLIILSVYIFLWIYFRPPSLPDRVVILPFQNGEKAEIVLTDALEQQLLDQLSQDYIFHRWHWLYQTADPDSVDLLIYRKKLAKRLGISVIISADVMVNNNEFEINYEIDQSGNNHKGQLKAKSVTQATRDLIEKISYHSDIISKESADISIREFPYDRYSKAKRAFLDRDYDRALDFIDESNLRSQILLANILLKKGIRHIPDGENSNLKEDVINPYFQRIKQILIPHSKKGKDTADLNLLLGQLYLFEKDYDLAEICLKKARTQDRYNSRIYYYMSYLLIDRIKELNYKDRIDVLSYCVQLDPGFSDGVYELASEYYNTGTGVPTGGYTERSIATMQNYLKINPNKQNILSLLGKIYLQSKFTEDAMTMYLRLLELDPQSAETNYNLGICYFHKKDYSKAEGLFKKAIDLNDHIDSYVYLGGIYKLREDWDQALYYFRERIKRKTGDDDKYAKEAMRGVRLILARQQADSSTVEEE